MESDHSCLSVISFNMHGFYQGFPAIEHLSESDTPPDILLLQEHWLTPANMDKFDIFPGFFLVLDALQ